MDPTPFPQSNVNMGAPPGMEKEVGSLPIYRTEGNMYSLWKPTEQELKWLNEGHPIVLNVLGRMHPPVSLFVYPDTSDFFNRDPKEEAARN